MRAMGRGILQRLLNANALQCAVACETNPISPGREGGEVEGREGDVSKMVDTGPLAVTRINTCEQVGGGGAFDGTGIGAKRLALASWRAGCARARTHVHIKFTMHCHTTKVPNFQHRRPQTQNKIESADSPGIGVAKCVALVTQCTAPPISHFARRRSFAT
eukprot:scaffold63052_cov32-Tisochrysis_lutea.AAC.2